MAVKTITYTLNAASPGTQADLITTDANLIYNIYGSADSYVTPIATTGAHGTTGVSVSAGVATITWEVGTETAFRVTSEDEAGNESSQSPTYDTVAGDTWTVAGFTESGGVYTATAGYTTDFAVIDIAKVGDIEFRTPLTNETLHKGATLGFSATGTNRYYAGSPVWERMVLLQNSTGNFTRDSSILAVNGTGTPPTYAAGNYMYIRRVGTTMTAGWWNGTTEILVHTFTNLTGDLYCLFGQQAGGKTIEPSFA